MIELGAWVPDQPDVSNNGVRTAKNVIPRASGYDSLPSLVVASAGSLNDLCAGAITGHSRSGVNFTAGGSINRLYIATTGTLANVSNGGGSPYTGALATSWWSFVLFGSRVIASNYSDAPEDFIVGVDTNFGALSADAPNAKHLAVVRDFVVAGNIIGRGANAATIGTSEDAIQWCAIDDPTSWPAVGTAPARAVQSDWQPLAGNGGQVTSLIGGADYGIVFQERAIWRMDYEGGETFFRIVPLESENRGCWIPKAAIRVGNLTYFPAEDGFFVTDGFQIIPIGNELVDKFFSDSFQEGSESRLSVAFFPEWNSIAWLYMGPNASAFLPNTLLVYNVSSQRWASADVSAEWLVNVLPFTDSLDDYSDSMDAGVLSAVSLDSLIGTAKRVAGGFDSMHSLATFTGGPGTAVIETNEFEPEVGRVGYVRSIRPIYEPESGASVSVQVSTKMRPSDSETYHNAFNEDATGKHCIRATGRYIASRFSLSGEFNNFSGFDADVVAQGDR